MKQQILPKKTKHKLQKVDIDQLQDQRKKEKIKNQLPPQKLKINLKWKLK